MSNTPGTRRNIGLSAFLLLGFIIFPFQTQADNYRQMREDFKNYDTSDFYKAAIVPAAPIKEVKIPEEEQLKAKEAQLRALQSQWEKIIEKTVEEDNSFYELTGDTIRQIRKIAQTEQIEELLQQELNLDILVAAAIERNPGLEKAKKEWQASLELFGQAAALDNILQQYNAFAKSLMLRTGAQNQQQMQAMRFPLPGTLALKGDIAVKEVQIAQESYRIAQRDLIYKVKQLYYELLYLSQAIQIETENLKLLKSLESVAFIKYKTGEASYSELIKVQIKIAKTETNLITLEEEYKAQSVNLLQILNMPPDFPLGGLQTVPVSDIARSLDELIDTALQNRQELKRMRLIIERDNLAIEMAEKELYPDFSLGMSFFENNAADLAGAFKQMETFADKPMAKPSFWYGKNEVYIREARLKYQALQKRLAAMENELTAKVKEQHYLFETAKRNVALYGDSLLKMAENALQVAKVDYQSGKIDFPSVLETEGIWLEYNLMYHRSLRNQRQGRARVERLTGVKIGN